MQKPEAKSAIESYLFKVRDLMADSSHSTKVLTAVELIAQNQKYRSTMLNLSGHLSRLAQKHKLNMVHEKRQITPSVDQKLSSMSKSIESNSKYDCSSFRLIELLTADASSIAQKASTLPGIGSLLGEREIEESRLKGEIAKVIKEISEAKQATINYSRLVRDSERDIEALSTGKLTMSLKKQGVIKESEVQEEINELTFASRLR